MWTKRLLFAALVLLCWAENINAESKAQGGPTEHAGHRVIAEIEITEKKVYYLHTTMTGFTREDTKSLCESLEMTMVKFETEGEWLSVRDWISNSEYSTQWLWTGAKRDAGNSTWYWEDTGAKIDDFFWGTNDQPDIGVDFSACMIFSDVFSWQDLECDDSKYQVICEMK